MCGYRIASLPVQISASPFWVESDEAAAARLVRLSRLPFVSSFNLTPVARGKLPTCPSPTFTRHYFHMIPRQLMAKTSKLHLPKQSFYIVAARFPVLQFT
jgi:hypothetical protein